MMHSFKIITSIVVLLAVILGISMYSSRTLAATSRDLESRISEIEESTKAGNWVKAKEGIEAIEANWQQVEKSWSILLDHIEIDNIDISLSKISRYIESENTSLALAEVATLKMLITHIPEKESFRLTNIL